MKNSALFALAAFLCCAPCHAAIEVELTFDSASLATSTTGTFRISGDATSNASSPSGWFLLVQEVPPSQRLADGGELLFDMSYATDVDQPSIQFDGESFELGADGNMRFTKPGAFFNAVQLLIGGASTTIGAPFQIGNGTTDAIVGTFSITSSTGLGTNTFNNLGFSNSVLSLVNILDSDGDGIPDGNETAGEDATGTVTGFGPTNPNDADSDNDGTDDNTEIGDGTNPNLQDDFLYLRVSSDEDTDDGDYSPGAFTLREAVSLANSLGLTTAHVRFTPELNQARFTLLSDLDISGLNLLLDMSDVSEAAVEPITVDGQDGALSGSGSLSLLGEVNETGSIIFESAHTYTGGTTMERTRLNVSNPSGSALGTGDLVMNINTQLTGEGIISGNVLAQNATATVVIGDPFFGDRFGTLTIGGDLDFTEGNLDFAVGDTEAAKLVVGGHLDLSAVSDGDLDVSSATSNPESTAYVVASYGSLTLPGGGFTSDLEGYDFDSAYNDGSSSNNLAYVDLTPLVEWTAGTADFFNAIHWNPNVAPNAGNDFIIRNGGTAQANPVGPGMTTTVNELRIGHANGTGELTANATNNFSLAVTRNFEVGSQSIPSTSGPGAINIDGSVTLAGLSGLDIDGDLRVASMFGGLEGQATANGSFSLIDSPNAVLSVENIEIGIADGDADNQAVAGLTVDQVDSVTITGGGFIGLAAGNSEVQTNALFEDITGTCSLGFVQAGAAFSEDGAPSIVTDLTFRRVNSLQFGTLFLGAVSTSDSASVLNGTVNGWVEDSAMTVAGDLAIGQFFGGPNPDPSSAFDTQFDLVNSTLTTAGLSVANYGPAGDAIGGIKGALRLSGSTVNADSFQQTSSGSTTLSGSALIVAQTSTFRGSLALNPSYLSTDLLDLKTGVNLTLTLDGTTRATSSNVGISSGLYSAIDAQDFLTGGVNFSVNINFLPSDGDRFVLINSNQGTISGEEFAELTDSASIQRPVGMTGTLTLESDVAGDRVVLTYTGSPSEAFDVWATARGLTYNVNDSLNESAGSNGRTNFEHYLFDTDPLGDGSNEGKRRIAIASVTYEEQTFDALTFTLPIHLNGVTEAVFTANGNRLQAIVGSYIVVVHGSSDLVSDDIEVFELPDALDAGLPGLGDYDDNVGPDYTYRTFALNQPIPGPGKGFITIEFADP
ncbi:beta strand repeat-containing protein [Haloferula sp.]|uniref:beta strand repeat-containing protein n=1 Tax=Haloferula sp. TaxID=2497595 RepID=UPI0032A05AC8